MIATNRNAGLIGSGMLLLALVGCSAGEPPATTENHAQTVERGADTEMVPAKPAMPSDGVQAAEAVEIRRSADGSSVELRKANPSDVPEAAEPARPSQPAQ